MSIARLLVTLFFGSLAFLFTACETTENNQSVLAPESKEDAIRVAVTGQVPQPGYYTVSNNANIATVLVQAGWTPYFAKEKYEHTPTIWIKRLSEGNQESWVFDMNEIYEDHWMDFKLQDGDIINVIIILF